MIVIQYLCSQPLIASQQLIISTTPLTTPILHPIGHQKELTPRQSNNFDIQYKQHVTNIKKLFSVHTMDDVTFLSPDKTACTSKDVKKIKTLQTLCTKLVWMQKNLNKYIQPYSEEQRKEIIKKSMYKFTLQLPITTLINIPRHQLKDTVTLAQNADMPFVAHHLQKCAQDLGIQ